MSKTLSGICELIVDSEHKTAPIQDVGLPMVRTPNIGSGRIIWEKMQFVSEDTFKAWTRRAVPQKDDLILAREAPVGNVIRVPEDNKFCLGQRTVLLRPKQAEVDPKYLLYYLLSPPVRDRLLSVSYGSTVDHLNMSEIRALDVSDMADLETQKVIGSVIYAFDNLIEINERKIKVLEEMARRIYREWFVDFRFPGHEKVKMIDSGHPDFGMIPEGWTIGKLEAILDLKSGYAFKGESFVKNGKIPLVTISNVHSERFEPNCASWLDSVPENVKPYCYLSPGDVLMSLTGNVGRVCRVYGGRYLLNQRVSKVISKTESGSLALPYCALNSLTIQDRLQRLAKGVAQPNLSPVEAVQIEYPIPSFLVIRQFEALVEPLLQLSLILREENMRLGALRDLLLPKLISGEIDVSDLNIAGLELDTNKLKTQTLKSESDQQHQARSNL